MGVNSSRRVRLVKGSHLVTRKFWEGNQAYLLQNTDKRVIFVNPYEGDLALIGTTDIPVEGEPEDAAIERARDRLSAGRARALLPRPARPEADIVHSFSGVRPLYDDSAENPSAVTRDYVFDVEPKAPEAGRAPLLSVFGGKITTYRKLAEHALDKLAPFFPGIGPAWTADRAAARRRHARRRLRALARRVPGSTPLAAASRWRGTTAASTAPAPRRCWAARCGLGDLGRHFGGLLYEREARFLLARGMGRDGRGHPRRGAPSTACTSPRPKPRPSGRGSPPRPSRGPGSTPDRSQATFAVLKLAMKSLSRSPWIRIWSLSIRSARSPSPASTASTTAWCSASEAATRDSARSCSRR